MSKGRILIVDDEAAVRRTVARALRQSGYESEEAADVAEARAMLDSGFDLVICDLHMPGENGLVLVEHVESDYPNTGVLMATGEDSPEVAHAASVHGASGYLVKPFTNNQLRINVEYALAEQARRSPEAGPEVERRVSEVRSALLGTGEEEALIDEERIAILERFCEAVGRRDLETGAHIRRIGALSAMLAELAGAAEEDVERIRAAAPMHDVGKVAVPDAILLKPGKLEPDERAVMERHAQMGHDILAGSNSALLNLAARIALTHHERFDGAGYPQGLRGEGIPLAGRLVAIADVFDALTTDRPYRGAMSLDEALEIMKAGRGTHFDPELFDIFMENLDDVIALKESIGNGRSAGG